MFNQNHHSQTKQRFTIKKFKVGTASVLIGTVFMLFLGINTAQATEKNAYVENTIRDTTEIEFRNDLEESKETDKTLVEPIKEDMHVSDEEKIVTKSYAVQPVEKPKSSAAPRPDYEGETMEVGTGFRTTVPRVSEDTAITEVGELLNIGELKEKTFWFDFGDTNSVTQLGPNNTLQVGTTYQKELTRDYVVKAVITELKPFAINERNMYRPDSDGGAKNTPAEVGIRKVDTRFSHLYKAGLLDSRMSVLGSKEIGGNIGFKVKITATYKGKAIAPTVLAADAEEANGDEALIFTTDGTPWEIYANVRNGENKSTTNPNTGDMTKLRTQEDIDKLATKPYAYTDEFGKLAGNFVPIDSEDLYNKKEGFRHANSASGTDQTLRDAYSKEGTRRWINSDLTTGGLGTKTFGPVMTSQNAFSVPIIESTAESEDGITLGVYINSRGAQHAVFGISFYDRGDAPASYGVARHLISESVDDPSPYLGTEKGDADIVISNSSWVADDVEDIKDEGNEQLTGNKLIKLVQADKDTYTLENIIANLNGNSEAFVRGFVDFNNNGMFDDSEASELVEVNSAGKIVLRFQNPPQIVDTSVDNVGVRVRISKTSTEVNKAIGVATSGEVEDFTTQVVHPPRGEKTETSGLRGVIQNAKVQFTAYGKMKDNNQIKNAIDSSQDVKIVTKDGSLVKTFTEEGEGTYTVDPSGNVIFKPFASFVGTAKGIVLRATDQNGLTTGWTSATGKKTRNNDQTEFINILENVNDGSHTLEIKTMDSVYIPTVTEINVEKEDKETTGYQGKKQTGSPSFILPKELVNVTKKYSFEDGLLTKTVQNQGNYTIDQDTGVVTFTPDLRFIGKADPVAVKQTVTVIGPDMDEDSSNVNNNVTTIETTANYQANVVAVPPLTASSTTKNIQGRVQKSPILFVEDDDITTLNIKPGDSRVPIDRESLTLIDGEGKAVEEVVVSLNDKKQGTYRLNIDKTVVIFTPEKDFVGTPSPAIIRGADINGTVVTASYTPTVLPRPITSLIGMYPQEPSVPIETTEITIIPIEEIIELKTEEHNPFGNSSISLANIETTEMTRIKLPKTGVRHSFSSLFGIASVIALLGIIKKRKQKED